MVFHGLEVFAGYDLILVARNGAQMEELAAKLRAEYDVAVDVIAADLTKSDDVTRIEQRLIDDAAITLFVNNAGMSLNGGTLLIVLGLLAAWPLLLALGGGLLALAGLVYAAGAGRTLLFTVRDPRGRPNPLAVLP